MRGRIDGEGLSALSVCSGLKPKIGKDFLFHRVANMESGVPVQWRPHSCVSVDFYKMYWFLSIEDSLSWCYYGT